MALIPWKSKEETAAPMTSWDRSMSRFRDEMDSLFDRFIGDRWDLGRDWARGPETLRADLSETDEEVTVALEVPGVDPKDLEIRVTGQHLSVRGQKRQEQEEKKRSYHYVERRYGSFERTIALPAGVDADKVDAKFHNGVVTIRMAKRPDAKPKRIPVTNA